MNVMDRRKIERAFSAAGDYDRRARVQKDVATALARRIAALDLPKSPAILEIGCGTGFLTGALAEALPEADLLVTDISPDMVERCRERVGVAPERRFAVLDGEFGTIGRGRPFDLVCSSLALQWFDDQETAVPRLLDWLAPGGHLLFTTLAADSFAEWRAAHAKEGLEAGTIGFLPAARFDALLPNAQAVPHTVDRLVEQHEDGMEFLRTLKAIGAHTARRQHRPLAPSSLRRVMRNFEEGGARITYEVVTCHYIADDRHTA